MRPGAQGAEKEAGASSAEGLVSRPAPRPGGSSEITAAGACAGR